jgi:hypothetical protein
MSTLTRRTGFNWGTGGRHRASISSPRSNTFNSEAYRTMPLAQGPSDWVPCTSLIPAGPIVIRFICGI